MTTTNEYRFTDGAENRTVREKQTLRKVSLCYLDEGRCSTLFQRSKMNRCEFSNGFVHQIKAHEHHFFFSCCCWYCFSVRLTRAKNDRESLLTVRECYVSFPSFCHSDESERMPLDELTQNQKIQFCLCPLFEAPSLWLRMLERSCRH